MTAVCLAAGLVFGIASGAWAKTPPVVPTPTVVPPTQTPAPAPLDTMTPGVQKSLLLIGVTDAAVVSPTLEAVWVITFRPGVAEYYVTAFPPSAIFEVPSLGGPKALRDIYAEEVRLQLEHNFLRDAVQSRFPAFTIQADVTVDRADVAALVSQLGGLPMNNQTLTGPDLLQAYDSWPVADEVDRVRHQGAIMLQLVALLAQRENPAADLVQFVARIPRVAGDTQTVEALELFASDAPPMVAEGLIWRVYGPEMDAATTP
jgi:hypothetical protein